MWHICVYWILKFRSNECNIQQISPEQNGVEHHAVTWAGGNQKKSISCQLCCLSFSSRNKLTIHLNNIHEKEGHLLDENLKPKFSKEECTFDCKECDLKFISQTSLNYHVKRKHGTGSFKCDFCGFKLSKPEALKHHQTICKAATDNKIWIF